MANCIVHIGMHKSGSTSIQNSLDGFVSDKHLYAKIGITPNHSLPIYTLFAKNPEKHYLHRSHSRTPEIIKKYKNECINDIENAIYLAEKRTVIISGEEINVLCEEEIILMRGFLYKYFDKVTVVAYVRPPSQYISSAFQQGVKDGSIKVFNIDKYYRSYRQLFEKFDKVFGKENVVLWEYNSKNFKNGCVVQDFCNKLEIILKSESIVRSNDSLSKDAVSLFYIYNKFCGKASFQERLKLRGILSSISNQKFIFSNALISSVLLKNSQDIGWIEDRTGISLSYENIDCKDIGVSSEQDLLSVSRSALNELSFLLNKDECEDIYYKTPQQLANLLDSLCCMVSGRNGKNLDSEINFPEISSLPSINYSDKKMKEIEILEKINDRKPNLLEGLPKNKVSELIDFFLKELATEKTESISNGVFSEIKDSANFDRDATKVLENKGVLVINPFESLPSERTVIVLGAARGGTSMVAGVLHQLGVSMGDKLSSVYEDLELSEAIEANNQGRIAAVIKKRDDVQKIWGWKRPTSAKYIDNWRGKFRNPMFVVVFRDIFAIANRNRISVLGEVLSDMRNILKHFGFILDFLESDNSPTLFVSYEKAMDDPAYFVNKISNFVGLGDEESIRKAIDFVEPNPITYLKSSRITETNGIVDKITVDRIYGWAIYKKRPNKPVKLIITINNNRVYEVIADQLRIGLKNKGIHSTGRCGFDLKLIGNQVLKPGDLVSVRADGDISDIRNSPSIVQ
ncbi:hypothetical protein JCM14076_31310 [Methylosoma difficile]